MKRVVYILFCLILGTTTSTGLAQKKGYPFQPLPLNKVHIQDEFWMPRIETNRTVTIPYLFKGFEERGRMDNFAIAGGLKQGEQKGSYPFDDSDIYKTIEGASYSLMRYPDPALDKYIDSLITLIDAAQEDDGYLYTARTNNTARLRSWFGDKRWERENGSHELYDAGHLYEAAAAHYLATGKKSLLNVALKNAELVNKDFGPGKLEVPPGHQVIEMGLVKLYMVTGDEKYLNLAKFFLDVRGKPTNGRQLGGEYNQDHKPVLEQNTAVGHSVRAVYMYGGIADVASFLNNTDYAQVVNNIWNDVVSKKIYVTGGVGASGSGEAFGREYYLPNLSSYCETCAAIGNVFWNHRMFLLNGDAKYIDVLERSLYNGFLAAVALDGTHFFYPNPLESTGQHSRQAWYTCSCCLGNLARFFEMVSGYVYANKGDNIYVNLYIGSDSEIETNGAKVKFKQETSYPWDGNVKITINPAQRNQSFAILLRIPGWAQNTPIASDLYKFIDSNTEQVSLTVNGQSMPVTIDKGYVSVQRQWNQGDVVELYLPMPVRRIVAHTNVEADRGKVALERGPLVYCLEWPDNKDGHVRNILLPDASPLSASFKKDLLNGVQIITGKAYGCKLGEDGKTIEKTEQDFTAIPYFVWANRGRGEMEVWIANTESAVTPLKNPSLASQSKVTCSFGPNPEAVKDLLEPKSSIDREVPYYHWWSHRGTIEWIQYDFPKEMEVSTVEVYWFDDTGIGECRVPKSWRILYREGNDWKPVYTIDIYGVEKDKFNKVVFETVKTTAVRLEMQSQENFAGGIHEWRIK